MQAYFFVGEVLFHSRITAVGSTEREGEGEKRREKRGRGRRGGIERELFMRVGVRVSEGGGEGCS